MSHVSKCFRCYGSVVRPRISHLVISDWHLAGTVEVAPRRASFPLHLSRTIAIILCCAFGVSAKRTDGNARTKERILAVVPILEYPHSILRQRAKSVLKIDKTVFRLADDLMDTLVDSGGVGLAANQIGSLRRVIALKMPEDEEPSVYINPKIVHREGVREVSEGCLSFPHHYGIVQRSMWVRVTGLDRKTNEFRICADGLLAQAFEHETDHLNGILFIDHLLSHEHLFEYSDEEDAESEQEAAEDCLADAAP